MATKNILTLTPAMLALISQKVSTSLSQVSPFRLFNTQAIDEGTEKQLREKGTLTSTNELAPATAALFEAIAGCEAYTRITNTGALGTYETIMCFCSGTPKKIALSTVSDGFEIDPEPSIENIVSMYAQFFGSSIMRSSDFDIELKGDEVLAFAGLFDAGRKAVNAMLATNGETPENSFALDAIVKQITPSGLLSNYISFYLEMFFGVSPSADSSAVAKALQALQSKGIVEKNGDSWTLSGNIDEAVQNFLCVNNLISVKTAHATKGDPIGVGFLCLQAGLHDILYIEETDNLFSVNSLSSATLLDYIANFCDNGDLLKSKAQEVTKASSTAAPGLKCSSCSQSLAADTKFCPSCGAKVEAAPGTCGKCGMVNYPQAKFCSQCGSKT